MTYVNIDCARVWKERDKPLRGDNLLLQLLWGDDLLSSTPDNGFTRVELSGDRVGWVKGDLPTTATAPLALVFLDVGQGDSCFMTTPGGQRILVDAGEQQMVARYLASRFSADIKAGHDVVLDALVISHGDADHFEGVAELVDAASEARERKGIRAVVRRVLHNGLVKRGVRRADGTDRSEAEMFGSTSVSADGTQVAVDLVDDVRDVPDAEMNGPFTRFRGALDELGRRGTVNVRRIDASHTGPFDFVEGATIQVLAPRPQSAAGQVGLELLGDTPSAAPTASGTINGNSIVLKVMIGNVAILLTGDATEATQAMLVHDHESGAIDLRAHVLKVPHHGGDGVALRFLELVKPIVSVISAGDEDARRDYLHPRANIVSRLGRTGDGDVDPVIFVTNLAAFDRWVGKAFPAKQDASGTWVPDTNAKPFYARERTRYGAVHLRTDGQRILVVRFGARREGREEYAYAVDATGRASPSPVSVY